MTKQRRSHVISTGVAKLRSEGAKLGVYEIFLKKKKKMVQHFLGKKWCEYVHSQVPFSTNFVSFLRHCLSILTSVFIGAACRTNRKYWCGEMSVLKPSANYLTPLLVQLYVTVPRYAIILNRRKLSVFI